MSGRWLFNTEPSDYSIDRLERESETRWDGVKNPLALKHLRAVRKGDEILVYHTGEEKRIVGLARAVGDAAGDGVRIRFARRLKNPVSLAQVKADPRFADFALVRISRLSVMPVPEPLWKILGAGN